MYCSVVSVHPSGSPTFVYIRYGHGGDQQGMPTSAVEMFQHNVHVNFPEDREHLQFLAPEEMRVCTKDEVKENRETEKQLFDPIVKRLATYDKLVEFN